MDDDKERLDVIPGVVPNPLDFPKGCKFHNRCEKCFGRCLVEEPPMYLLSDNRKVRCWLYENHPKREGIER